MADEPGTRPRFRVVLFETPEGRVPVEEFLESLPDERHNAKIQAWIAEPAAKNLSLREPYVKALGEGLWELRVRHARYWYRILFFYHEGAQIVLTNGFRKQTAKTPRQEIERASQAKKLYERYRNRYPGKEGAQG